MDKSVCVVSSKSKTTNISTTDFELFGQMMDISVHNVHLAGILATTKWMAKLLRIHMNFYEYYKSLISHLQSARSHEGLVNHVTSVSHADDKDVVELLNSVYLG